MTKQAVYRITYIETSYPGREWRSRNVWKVRPQHEEISEEADAGGRNAGSVLLHDPAGVCRRKYHTIYLEPQGGIGVPTQVYVYKYNDVYRASSLPTPTMEGYTFDGWYEDIVGGTAIKVSKYNFKEEGQTLYAHWTVADGSSSSAAAAQPEETKPSKTFKIEEHMGEILIVGTTVLVFTLVALHG